MKAPQFRAVRWGSEFEGADRRYNAALFDRACAATLDRLAALIEEGRPLPELRRRRLRVIDGGRRSAASNK